MTRAVPYRRRRFPLATWQVDLPWPTKRTLTARDREEIREDRLVIGSARGMLLGENLARGKSVRDTHPGDGQA